MSVNCLYLNDRGICGRFSTEAKPIPFSQNKDQPAGVGEVKRPGPEPYQSPIHWQSYENVELYIHSSIHPHGVPLYYHCVLETFSHIRILKTCLVFITATESTRGPGSSVGIATNYGLDGSGIESRLGEIFRPSSPALGPTQPPVQWVPGLCR